jgi:AcrR family transcriptional regulator
MASMNDFVYINGRPAHGAHQRAARTRGPRASGALAQFQRLRLLKAALDEVAESGSDTLTVGAVIERAHVSRKTFYDLFENCEACLLALFEQSLARMAAEAAPVYERAGNWPQCLRPALVALLGFCEREPAAGALVLGHLLGRGPESQRPRSRVLDSLYGILDEGSLQLPRREPAPLAAEFVVGGVLAVTHARLCEPDPQLMDLVNPLMWMIVLPYRGAAAAARELKRPTPEPPAPAATRTPDSDPLRRLKMRLTYRTANVLEVIAATPGLANSGVSARAGITDQGQISKLLSRLARLGLIENLGPGQVHGAANAWWLTPLGGELEATFRRKTASEPR